MRKVINVSVPEGIYKQVEKEVKEGGFASKSEYIRHLIREYQRKLNKNKKRPPLD